ASPTNQPLAASSSISLDAFERLPTLFFKRWIRIELREPPGLSRGTKKHDKSSPSIFASIRWASHCGAEKNHLCPVSRYSSPHAETPARSASVVLKRRSEPPCFSVMPIPIRTPSFRSNGTGRG